MSSMAYRCQLQAFSEQWHICLHIYLGEYGSYAPPMGYGGQQGNQQEKEISPKATSLLLTPGEA
jgi:hypothetical protein